jgi:hypothetical protein
MADLLSQFGLGLLNRQEPQTAPVNPELYGPYAPVVQGLEKAVQTYVNQRQESVMLDSVADTLANELSRYATKGRIPESYLDKFANFNSLPLTQKRALVSQGAILLQQNQARDEVEAEQGRANLQLMGNLMTRLVNAANIWTDNRRLAAQESYRRQKEQQEARQAKALLKSSGIPLPKELEGEEGISPELARTLISHARQTNEQPGLFENEADAAKAAEYTNRQLEGTNRKAVVVPAGGNRWRISVIPIRGETEPEIEPELFDLDKSGTLDADEAMKYKQALVESKVFGGVYAGMPVRSKAKQDTKLQEVLRALEKLDTSVLR